jgi:phosphoribosylpyrophosphate synthetase
MIFFSFHSVTAIADKLGLDFALIHKHRNGKSECAPEKMELLVGNVKDKVSIFYGRYSFSVHPVWRRLPS